ncbi:MAG: HAD family hydrolase [Holophaga sp.]|nr:HAD family hydrolase [Holophaga sp.]
MAAVKALVFDLDDTLYPEVSYVLSAFRAVAAWLEEAAALPADRAFAWMEEAFTHGSRRRIFDRLLAAFPSASGKATVAQLVRVYRSHPPAIALYPHMAELLDEARARSLRIAVISDGYLEAQRQKARALGLSRWAEPILFTDAWGPQAWKPNPMVFSCLQEALELSPEQMVYIGDNPVKDFQAPNLLGWNSIQLVLPGQCATGRPVSQARIRVEGIPALWQEILA